MTTTEIRAQSPQEAFPTLSEFAASGHAVQPGTESIDAALEREHHPLKVALLQIKTRPTRISENVGKIKQGISAAESAGADLVVAHELAIPGYSCLDRFLDQRFIEANIEGLREIVEHTRGLHVTAVVGFVDRGPAPADPSVPRDLYNSVAVIRDGKLIDIVDKTLLPDYDIFWERRYFKSGRKIEPVRINGTRIGIEVCEDLWDRTYPTKVSDELARKGADVLINLSASPFHPGKVEARAELIRQVAARNGLPFIYSNLVGAQDGYEGEIVFDGRSMIFDREGRLTAIGSGFKEEMILVDVHGATPIELPQHRPVEEIFDALVLGIRDYCERNGFKRVYIGLSGGIDSAVVAALAVEALGAENVIGVTMPSHITSEETYADALALARNLGIKCHVRSIAEQYSAWEKSAREAHPDGLQSITKQNVQARIRCEILHEYTNEDRASMVLSTGNKTELALGYCTLYGDMGGGLAVISDVSKLMVYELAREFNRRSGLAAIPETTIQRTPTAELEEGQTDAANLPADYPILSPLVDDIVEHGLDREELIKIYPPEVVDKTIRLIQIAEYKRRQAAPGIRVSQKAFGPGRRYAVDEVRGARW